MRRANPELMVLLAREVRLERGDLWVLPVLLALRVLLARLARLVPQVLVEPSDLLAQ